MQIKSQFFVSDKEAWGMVDILDEEGRINDYEDKK